MNPFGEYVAMSCQAEVGGEWIQVRQQVVKEVYDDPAARQVVEAALRQALMAEILKKWSPAIRVHGA